MTKLECLLWEKHRTSIGSHYCVWSSETLEDILKAKWYSPTQTDLFRFDYHTDLWDIILHDSCSERRLEKLLYLTQMALDNRELYANRIVFGTVFDPPFCSDPLEVFHPFLSPADKIVDTEKQITQLMMTCQTANDLNEVQKLVEQGCDVFHMDKDRKRVIFYAIQNPNHSVGREIALYLARQMNIQERQYLCHRHYVPSGNWENSLVNVMNPEPVDFYLMLDEGGGSFQDFYENGVPAADNHFDGMDRHGMNTFYYPNGNVALKLCYEHGQLTGDLTGYHKNGQVMLEGSYAQNLPVGMYKFYGKDGHLKAEWSVPQMREQTRQVWKAFVDFTRQENDSVIDIPVSMNGVQKVIRTYFDFVATDDLGKPTNLIEYDDLLSMYADIKDKKTKSLTKDVLSALEILRNDIKQSPLPVVGAQITVFDRCVRRLEEHLFHLLHIDNSVAYIR